MAELGDMIICHTQPRTNTDIRAYSCTFEPGYKFKPSYTKSYLHEYTYKYTHKDAHKYATYRYTLIQIHNCTHTTKNAHKYTYS